MSFAEIMIQEEMELKGLSRDEVRENMRQNLEVMRDAVVKGTTGEGVKVLQAILDMTQQNYVIITKIIMRYQAMK